jgi:hypothetical protein
MMLVKKYGEAISQERIVGNCGVCTDNLSSGVVVVKSAKDGV